MESTDNQYRRKMILAFGLVYLFWGSTYLGIRIAVVEIPPLLMAAVRFAVAGPVMLLWCAHGGRRLAINWSEGIRLAVLGVLMLSVGNVVVAWAEQWVPSGLAALMISITPMWFLILQTWVFPGKHRVSGRALAGLGLGVCGIVVLLWPELRHTNSIGRPELLGSLSLLGSSFIWALGSILSKRWKPRVDPLTAAGYQMTFSGLVNLLLATALGEWTHATWSWRGTGAVLYLMVFGSWVAFSAYVWLLSHVPITKVSTYAYVNPVVAVILGWVVAGEQITGYILTGAVIVIVAVALVTGAELKPRVETAEAKESLAACETTCGSTAD
jgi:drug/metabolite transporter (DMT)-like permease